MTSTETRAPGLLMIDLEGPQLSREEAALLAEPVVGGVILFSRNIENREQVVELTQAIRRCDPALLIAVDQEGGRVQRLREGFTRLPEAAVFGRIWQQDTRRAVTLARETGWLMAAEVLASGIDFSFAPVLDLDTGMSEVIGDRAFAGKPAVAAALALAWMDGMHKAGMATTGKHFPGHGNVTADSHEAIPVDERPLQQILDTDLQVFLRCQPELDAIMPAHVIYTAADSVCAGFSTWWLRTLLREQLNFQGAIFSDDLCMAGAASVGGIEQRVDAALAAGCDMVLLCNDRAAALTAIQHLSDRPGTRPMQRLRAMAARAKPDLGSGADRERHERAREMLATVQ